jgi:hypothetical protein
LNFEAEKKKAEAMLLSFGRSAAQRASDHADRESLSGNHEKAAYWRRIMALIAGASRRHSIQAQHSHGAIFWPERPAT